MKTKTVLLSVSIGFGLLCGCASLKEKEDLPKSTNIESIILKEYDSVFFTDFRNDGISNFNNYEDLVTAEDNGVMYFIGKNETEPRSQISRKGILARNGAIVFRFKPIDKTSFTISSSYGDWKSDDFQWIGLDFYSGNSVVIDEMHGSNPAYRNMEWKNDGIRINSTYALLIKLDAAGKISFELYDNIGLVGKYRHSESFVGNRLGFTFAMEKGRLSVLGYSEYIKK